MSDSESEILLLRLSSGEEVIAKVEEVDTSYQLTSPLAVVLRPDSSGGLSVSFMPFMTLADQHTVLIMGNHIQGIAVPNEDTKTNYSRLIGDTLIETPPEKKILLS